MSDFECLMQLLGADAQKDIRDYLSELLMDELKQAFEEDWIFPKDMLSDIFKDAIEDMAYGLLDEYKAHIRKVLEKELLNSLREEVMPSDAELS